MRNKRAKQIRKIENEFENEYQFNMSRRGRMVVDMQPIELSNDFSTLIAVDGVLYPIINPFKGFRRKLKTEYKKNKNVFTRVFLSSSPV